MSSLLIAQSAAQVAVDLKVKVIWLVVDSDDRDTKTAHHFFQRNKPLATLQYLEKSLLRRKTQGIRLSLVAAFANYATLMSKIGEHGDAQRLVIYALQLLSHYVSSDGKIVKGRQVSEKISLDGPPDEKADPRFASVRSTAAVVLHNVAVALLLLADVPNFGDCVTRSGEASLAAQSSLGERHPWRQQMESTHHVIIQLCKKGERLDIRQPLKVQVAPLKYVANRRHPSSKGLEASSPQRAAREAAVNPLEASLRSPERAARDSSQLSLPPIAQATGGRQSPVSPRGAASPLESSAASPDRTAGRSSSLHSGRAGSDSGAEPLTREERIAAEVARVRAETSKRAVDSGVSRLSGDARRPQQQQPFRPPAKKEKRGHDSRRSTSLPRATEDGDKLPPLGRSMPTPALGPSYTEPGDGGAESGSGQPAARKNARTEKRQARGSAKNRRKPASPLVSSARASPPLPRLGAAAAKAAKAKKPGRTSTERLADTRKTVAEAAAKAEAAATRAADLRDKASDARATAVRLPSTASPAAVTAFPRICRLVVADC